MHKKRKLIKILVLIIPLLIFFITSFDPIKAIDGYSDYYHIEIKDSKQKVMQTIISNKRITYVSLEEIPVLFTEIVISLEDKNFYNHSGFDTLRIIKAIYNNLFKGKFEGASTITQQYIKNTYLTGERKMTRKINELLLGIKLENKYPKGYILEKYLNTIYFGNNIYGIANATNYYFNKPLSKINPNEMALLYALLKAPNHYDPLRKYPQSMEKKDIILDRLYQNAIISEADYLTYHNQEIPIYGHKKDQPEMLYYLDTVISEFKSLEHKSEFEEKLEIATAYNPDLNSKLRQYRAIDSEYALVSLTNKGFIEALIGGTSYYNSPYNIATLGNRDIGSTIKPLLYYEALKCGITAEDTFVSEPIRMGQKTITNYHDIYPPMPINMAYALATSDNIYAVKVIQEIGPKTLCNCLAKFQVSATPSLNLALGNVSMSLMKLTKIYYTINSGGYYPNSKAITGIRNQKKNLLKRKIKQVKLLDSESCNTISSLMRGMFEAKISAHITGNSIKNSVPHDTRGKSGLTDFDSYMVGFTQNRTIGVWIGYADNSLLVDSTTKALAKKIFAVAITN